MKKQAQIIKDVKDLGQEFGLIIGNFDGFHLGHKALVKRFVNYCKENSLISVAMTFDPHPKIFIQQEKRDFLLMNYEKRNEQLYLEGVESIIELKFDESIQQLTAKDFLMKYLIANTKLRYIHLGHDFKLGKGKSDAKEELARLISNTEITIYHEKAFTQAKQIVSSSLIRKWLKKDISQVNQFLGRNFKINGRVDFGKGIGKKKLFPTANLNFDAQLCLPGTGVYISKIHIDGKAFESITNIGVNPTIATGNSISIETHLLFYQGDLYHKSVELEFIKKMRNEMKFDSIDELRWQIGQDIEDCKEYFRELSSIKLALIGKNIAHSKSQQMYEEILSCAVNYTLIDCQSTSDIPAAKNLLQKYAGISITAPYKKHFLDEAEVLPKHKCGVNTLYRHDGIIYGENTDVAAIENIINEYMQRPKRVIVLGSGVMAEIVQEELKKKEVSYTQLSRRAKNLDQLEAHIIEGSLSLLVINTCAREYTFDGPINFCYDFWDMNYDLKKHQEYFADGPVKYSDGLLQLKLQAKYAVNCWNLNSF